MHPRQEWHERAKELIRQGDYVKALAELKACLDLLGPHVDLLCDLAGVYYRLNEFEKFKLYTIKAYSFYKAHQQMLNESTEIYVRYKLTNSLMEMGALSLAQPLFQNMQRPLHSRKDRIQYDRLVCAKLDFAILNQNTKTLRQSYRELESIAETTEISEATIQHSLSQADFVLTGRRTADARVLRALSSNKINASDREWIFFDHLFNYLYFNSENDFNAAELRGFEYEKVGRFEKLVWDIYLKRIGRLPLKPVTLDRLEGMNVLSIMRILSVILNSSCFAEIYFEAKNKLDLYLSELDKSSQNILTKYFFSHLNSKAEVSVHDGRVKSKIGVISFKGISRELIEMMTLQDNPKIQDVCLRLFGEETNEMTMNRLRVALSRLNKKLFELTGVQNSISIHDSVLMRNVSFKRAS